MASLLKRFFMKQYQPQEIGGKVYNAADYDASYVVPKKLLRVTGIQMVDNVSKFVSSCLDLFYWFEFSNLLWVVPSEFLGIVMAASIAGSFNEAIGVFRMIPCFGASILALFKSFKMVYNRAVYENLVMELRRMWPHQGTVSEREHRVIQRALNQLNIIVKGYFWCNNVLLISFLAPPFFITAGRYMGYDLPMNLHFIYWLPFDPIQPVYYEIMLVIQTWHALIVIYWNVSWDMLFCTFICHITIQFDLLAMRIQRLFHVKVDQQLPDTYPLASISKEIESNRDNINPNSKEDWEIRNQKELADIISRHHTLIRLSKDVEVMFSLALLINFINGSVIICFCGFCSILVEKWNDVAYKSFLLTTLSQTWLLCWHGQKLIDSSLGVSEALYNCGWYKATKRMRKSILIMLHRAQKSVHVTSYGFSAISLASFNTIVKTSWSYFTLILNAYEK